MITMMIPMVTYSYQNVHNGNTMVTMITLVTYYFKMVTMVTEWYNDDNNGSLFSLIKRKDR